MQPYSTCRLPGWRPVPVHQRRDVRLSGTRCDHPDGDTAPPRHRGLRRCPSTHSCDSCPELVSCLHRPSAARCAWSCRPWRSPYGSRPAGVRQRRQQLKRPLIPGRYAGPGRPTPDFPESRRSWYILVHRSTSSRHTTVRQPGALRTHPQGLRCRGAAHRALPADNAGDRRVPQQRRLRLQDSRGCQEGRRCQVT